MTTVTFHVGAKNCTMIAKGHADYAESGKDIVCAGITAIIYALAGFLINDGGTLDELQMEPGYTKISADGDVLAAFRQAYYGLLHIQQKFPENLEVFYDR